MKTHLLCFAVAFLGGFGLLSIKRPLPNPPVDAEAPNTLRPSASHRLDEAFSEYEAIMLEDDEKLTLLVDQANTLNALLGAAERITSANGGDENVLQPIARKLARLYPAEALCYYATRPTNAKMNESMWKKILYEWGKNDIAACLAYLTQDSHTSLYSSSDIWNKVAKENSPEQLKECIQSFASMSKEKQNALIDNHYMPDLLPHLLSAIKDPTVLAEAQESVNNTNEAKAKSDSAPKGKSESEIEREREEALVKHFQNFKPDPTQLAELLRKEPSDSVRSSILRAVYSPSDDEKSDIDLWFSRVATLGNSGNEILPYPPVDYRKNDAAIQQKLEQWLPGQSPRLQRAWADDIVEGKPKEQALEWIGQLSTASLRSDMRDEVISTWIDEYPQEAADYLINKAISTDQEAYLPDAIYTWALRDYASATRWLDSTPNSPAKTATLLKLKQGQGSE